MKNILFQHCHEEQIHQLNEINRQGYIIGVDINTFDINFASENITGILDNRFDIHQILGSELNSYFQFDYDFSLILQKKEGDYTKETYSYNGISYFVVVYHFNNHFYIEMEIDFNPNNYPTYDKYAESILISTSKKENWQTLVDSIKSITGYNRVLIYKFLEDNNGVCIAENVDEGFESYLGLHFPEFDIPKQARALYVKKRNRIVSDVDDERIPILSKNENPVDLTYSEFRALSKVHLQYLRNFNASASFSISIVVNGKLWGLVACQNKTPKHIPINLRLQCVSLTKISRVSYVNFKYEKKISQKERFNTLLVNLKQDLLIEDDYNKIISNFEGMLKFSKADGVAFYKDGKIFKSGNTPSDQEIISIKQWASDQEITDLFISNSFYKDHGDQINVGPYAAGVAFKFLTKSDTSFLIWTKKEAKIVKKWAGNPVKSNTFLNINDDVKTLAPRTNFSIWENITNKESKIWKEKDIQSIKEIITLILETSHIKSLKIAELYSQLKEVNSELDTFTYTVSHDLRTPLSVMKLNCQLLQKNLKDGDLNQDRIKNIILEIDNLTFMMQEILQLSKAKKSDILIQEINCEELIKKIIYESKIHNNLPNTEVVVKDLKSIYADKTMAYEIFLNVINNAIKYSAKEERPLVEISTYQNDNYIIYCIKDNGIGIKESDRDKMFKLFSRMSNTDGFRGNGVGLSIVQRMMDRLDGSIDFESEVNKGTKFILKFKIPA